MNGAEVANTLITAAVIAIEVSELPGPPPDPWCSPSDDETDPPHTCPGNGTGVTPPPPPPGD